MSEYSKFERKDGKDNILLGFDVIKEIAAKYETELRGHIRSEDERLQALKGLKRTGILKSPIDDHGSIQAAAEKMAADFEVAADQKKIDLEDFYSRAGQYTFTGMRFEKDAFMRIMDVIQKRQQDKTILHLIA